MTEFHQKNHIRRSFTPRTRNMLALGACLIIGGGTFAAAGGVSQIRKWLQVEINGEAMNVELDENGESTFDYDTADGGTATVHVQSTDTEDGKMTRVNVVKDMDGGSSRSVAEVVRKEQIGVPEGSYSMEDLAGTQPLASWITDDGVGFELYGASTADGSGTDLYLLSETVGSEAEINKVQTLPMNLWADGSEHQVTIDPDGQISIVHENGNEKQQLRMRFSRGHATARPIENEPVDVDTPIGNIRISD